MRRRRFVGVGSGVCSAIDGGVWLLWWDQQRWSLCNADSGQCGRFDEESTTTGLNRARVARPTTHIPLFVTSPHQFVMETLPCRNEHCHLSPLFSIIVRLASSLTVHEDRGDQQFGSWPSNFRPEPVTALATKDTSTNSRQDHSMCAEASASLASTPTMAAMSSEAL